MMADYEGQALHCRMELRYVEISCEGFPNFGIWSAGDAPFVCLEPWMGRCDNTGYDKELSQKPNINVLEPEGILINRM